ncbi:dystrophin-related protein 2-like isoform X2 [Amphibalanus amphitrite]|nr:dystrophin-related protein 2-like isoform X2 [Amphibalanus amphitrite]XP_043236646.1 dystrophin-related protein 2-like isoform X2 [Amphibalanus amphitrite]
MASTGWTRVTSAAGVPYYVHHGDQRTSWTHPRLTAALQCIQECAYVRYAAYRMAVKCRHLRHVLLLDTVTLADVKAAFAAHGLAAAGAGEALNCDRVAEVLETLLDVGDGCAQQRADPLLSAALTVLDRRRAGAITTVSLKLLLGLLCSGRLTERYRFMYAELADVGDVLPPAQLGRLLEVAAALAELLGEREAFGRHLIAGTVRSCFGRGGGAVGAGANSRDSLMVWLLREPQMLVWVSTLYRLVSAQAVVHSVSCGVCGVKPVVGLCYACLRCLNFYLCQECFFRGLTNRGHKQHHPLQEFCAQWNRRQKTQALFRTLWNKLSGKTGRKPATLPPAKVTVDSAQQTSMAAPVAGSEDPPSSSSSEDEEDEDLSSRTLLDGTVSCDPQLDSILGHLEMENGRLAGELRRLRHVLPPGERLPEAEQQEMHCQLQRLRSLVRRRRGGRRQNQPRTPSPPPRPAHMQSTPMPRFSQLSPIARVPGSPVDGALSPIHSGIEAPASVSPPLRRDGSRQEAADAPTDQHATLVPGDEHPAEPAAESGTASPEPLTFSAHLPDLTEYSLSDLADVTGLADPEEPAAPEPPLAPSAAVQDTEVTLAALRAELTPLERTVERGPELWPARALTGTVPLQTAGELLELLADLENLCVSVQGGVDGRV